MDKRTVLAVGTVIGGVIAARRLLRSMRTGGIMERMMERMPPDSPPKLIMSILPRLRDQNDVMIGLLREQNELLHELRRSGQTADFLGPPRGVARE